jgi:hypothetical protein
MIEFDYRRESLRTGEIIFRPVAKVYLRKTDGEWVAEYLYVDSGADYTLIPYRMGRFLGLNAVATEVKEIGGIGGVIGVRLAIVPMRIGKYQFDCAIAWAQIERVPLLLGREGVFEHFEVTFRQKARKVIFVLQD